MRITPLDIQSQRFPRRVAGYDPQEVDAFLHLLASDYEKVIRESGALRETVRQLEARVEELQANERILQETLTTAHRLSEDLKQTAVKESEALLSQAELKGEKILQAAHRRAARLAEDIREMKLLRTRLAAAVRSTIETHLQLLEGIAAEDERADPVVEGKIASLEPGPRRPPESGRGA